MYGKRKVSAQQIQILCHVGQARKLQLAMDAGPMKFSSYSLDLCPMTTHGTALTSSRTFKKWWHTMTD